VAGGGIKLWASGFRAIVSRCLRACCAPLVVMLFNDVPTIYWERDCQAFLMQSFFGSAVIPSVNNFKLHSPQDVRSGQPSGATGAVRTVRIAAVNGVRSGLAEGLAVKGSC
jgi:hypothetical protein